MGCENKKYEGKVFQGKWEVSESGLKVLGNL